MCSADGADQLTFLVTGTNGYIGRNLVSALESKGQKVRPIKFFDETMDLQSNICHITEQLSEVEDLNVEGFIHCAWLDVREITSKRHHDTNLPLSKKLLELVFKRVCKNIHVLGSCLEYGPNGMNCVENQVTISTIPYADAKLQLYQFLKEELGVLNLNWYRIFYLFGGNQDKNTLYGSLKHCIEKKQQYFYLNEPDKLIDYLHVYEATDIISDFIVKRITTDIVNISSGRAMTLKSHVHRWIRC